MTPVEAQALSDSLITKHGTRVSLTRGGSPVAKAHGLFTTSDSNDWGGGGSSPMTGVTGAHRYCLIAGGIKKAPQVDDVLTSAQGTFSILEVEVVQPGPKAILYKCRLSQ